MYSNWGWLRIPTSEMSLVEVSSTQPVALVPTVNHEKMELSWKLYKFNEVMTCTDIISL